MIRISRSTLLASLFAIAAASPAVAQRAASPSLNVYGGLSLGPQKYPDEINPGCSLGTFGVGEARAGVSAGLLSLEVRGTATLARASATCIVFDVPDDADVFAPPQDGIHTFREYGYDTEDPDGSLDARLRLGGTESMPVTFAVGGGRLMGPGVSYGVASVGFRSRGAMRLAVDVEGSLFRLPSELVRVEFQDGEVVRTVSRESDTKWARGVGLRIGVERELF